MVERESMLVDGQARHVGAAAPSRIALKPKPAGKGCYNQRGDEDDLQNCPER